MESEDYALYYSWPFQLIGPVLIVVAVLLPILIRFLDSKPVGMGIWLASIGLVLFGLYAIAYHAVRLEVTSDELRLKRFGQSNALRWDDIATVESDRRKFILRDEDGRTYRIDTAGLRNGERFVRSLDARFGSNGRRRRNGSRTARR